MRLKFNKEQGKWELYLEKGDEDVVFCKYCGKKVENSGFFCQNRERLIHISCEEKDNHANCRGRDIEHIHYRVTLIVPKGFGDEKNDQKSGDFGVKSEEIDQEAVEKYYGGETNGRNISTKGSN